MSEFTMKLRISISLMTLLLVSCVQDLKQDQEVSNPDMTQITVEQRQQYIELKTKAWKSYKEGNHQEAASLYQQAFQATGGAANYNDRYNAACAMALTGQTEIAFDYLFQLAKNEPYYKNYEHISTDPDLESLQSNDKWKELLELVNKNKKDYEANLDLELKAELETILSDDTRYRNHIDSVIQNYGLESTQYAELTEKILSLDSVNLIKVKNIIAQHGWLGPDEVGQQGSDALFLVLQHADLETQKEYLPIFKKAVEDGKAIPFDLAYLEDRINATENRKQRYGTQLAIDTTDNSYYVWPIQKPDSVDQRRITVGLGTMQEYLKNFGMDWDLEAHKERIAAFEKETSENSKND